jgi:nucleotide-binding universal stress UspA family protein
MMSVTCNREGYLGKQAGVFEKEVKQMYKRILLPLDGSEMAEQALPHAVAQAEHFGAELTLLRVLEPFPQVRGVSLADLTAIRQQTTEWTHDYFDRITADLRDRDIPVETAIVEGRPNVAITQYAEANQVDLIVICARSRSGFSRWLMGSVADRVVRGATVPVLLVRAAKEKTEA